MTFTGWPPSAIRFFEGLEADNSRTYWVAHKAVYDADVKAPMEALVAELEDEFGEGRLFRPYRDTRFSADKTPYKTSIAARLGAGYIALSAGGLQAGAGLHQMSPAQLARYRSAVDADRSGRALEGIVAALRGGGLDVVGFDELKTAPRGFAKDHRRVELLRYKGIAAMRSWPAGRWLASAEAEKRLETFFRAAGPLVDWLTTHVGADEAEAGRR